jgi:NTP pyrophosphatase (non-canonical NTP hydrolase)
MQVSELQSKAVKLTKELDSVRNIKHDKNTALQHICEELGEITREIFNKETGRFKFDKYRLGEEIADLIILINHLAYLYNIHVEEAIEFKIKNLRERFGLIPKSKNAKT